MPSILCPMCDDFIADSSQPCFSCGAKISASAIPDNPVSCDNNSPVRTEEQIRKRFLDGDDWMGTRTAFVSSVLPNIMREGESIIALAQGLVNGFEAFIVATDMRLINYREPAQHDEYAYDGIGFISSEGFLMCSVYVRTPAGTVKLADRVNNDEAQELVQIVSERIANLW